MDPLIYLVVLEFTFSPTSQCVNMLPVLVHQIHTIQNKTAVEFRFCTELKKFLQGMSYTPAADLFVQVKCFSGKVWRLFISVLKSTYNRDININQILL